MALVDDACLQIVPGSHRRYRTEYERQCLLETRHEDITDQHTVDLKAGQAVFWNGNSIHRGVYKKDAERLTVSAAWSKHAQDSEKQETDSRLKWRLDPRVRETLPLAVHLYYDRWRELQLG